MPQSNSVMKSNTPSMSLSRPARSLPVRSIFETIFSEMMQEEGRAKPHQGSVRCKVALTQCRRRVAARSLIELTVSEFDWHRILRDEARARLGW
jgi:hypothetical protein